ncbi:MAG: amidase [Alphaproteobacteria bacterium]
MTDLHEYLASDATGIGALVNAGEVTAAELAALARQAHDRVNPRLNGILEFYQDAEEIDGPAAGPFAGVPFLRKDIGATEKDRLQENGSRLFAGIRPTSDSYYMRRAKASGLRIVGRSATPELGTAGFTESILSGITRNPWNLDLTAGGSSGGSAVSVASGIVPIAHASDGGGSIRIPAANCGVVGLNPSRGRISGGPARQGSLFGLTREFVVCPTVRDMALALDVFSGPRAGDPFIIAPPAGPYVEELGRATATLNVGVATTAWGDMEIEPEILALLQAVAGVVEGLGHNLEEMNAPFDLMDVKTAVTGGFHLGITSLDRAAEALGRPIDETTLEPVNLNVYRQSKDFPLSHAGTIFEAMRKVRADVGMATEKFDVLLTPSMPRTAQPHGLYATTNENLSTDEFWKGDTGLYQFMGAFNVTGQQSISLPLGQSSDGLPIGIQIVAGFGHEAILIRLARDLEEAMPWIGRLPPVHTGHQ